MPIGSEPKTIYENHIRAEAGAGRLIQMDDQKRNTGFLSDGKRENRVAFYGFRSGRGGISHVMLNLMHGMLDHGTSVDLLLNNTGIPELSDVRPGIRVVELGQVDGLRRVPSLVRYLRHESPSALLVNREPANRTVNMARNLCKTPPRITVRVGMAISIALKRRNFIKRWLRQRAIVYCYRRAECIIANSADVAEDIRMITGIPLDRIHVINNPTVAPELFRQAEEPVDHPWFTPGAPPVVLGVGRLAKQKDFPTLLRAFAKVRARRECRLVILGEGKERDGLEALAAELGIGEDADFPGYAANPFAYMSRASLFVLSSAWEGSPNVLIQAQALGLPSVATDCRGGSRHILSNGRYGPLTPVGDPDALSREMLRTLDDPPDKEFIQTAADRFRADACAREYLTAMGLGKK